MSTFDAQAFLDATIDQALEKRDPLPATQEYTAVVGEIGVKQGITKDTARNPNQPWAGFEVPLQIEVPIELQQSAGGQSTITLRDLLMLDLTPQGGIDTAKGKNGRLRMYREALDMNKAGEPFNPRNMQGRVLKVRIKHEEYPEGSGNLQERVQAVTKA